MRARVYDVTILIGNRECEVQVEHAPGSPPSYDDPGDGGETWPIGPVVYLREDGTEDVVTWETAILDSAVLNERTYDEAEQKVLDKLHEMASAKFAEESCDE